MDTEALTAVSVMDINPTKRKIYVAMVTLLGLTSLVNLSTAAMPDQDDLTRPVLGVENKLISTLLMNYSKYGRPIADISLPVSVEISFYLTQLMSLEEKHQVLTTFGWLETAWRDEYLVWNKSDYGGLDQLVLSPELVWLPDFGVENSARAIYDELFFKRFRVSVSENGSVQWVPGGKFVTSCQLDITFYPFDVQECHIDLVDWAYHGLQVQLLNGRHHIGLDAYTESGEWAIVETQAVSNDQYYESDPGVPFPRVRFTLLLRRKPMFYTINIITPCMTMSLLALLVFYLPPDSGEKVSLGITVLLSFSVFLLLVADNVPKTSEFVPLLGIYLTLIMAMTAMSILICVVVLNIHHRDPCTPVPIWLQRLAYNIMAPIVCMRHVVNARGSTVYQLCETSREYQSNSTTKEHQRDPCHTNHGKQYRLSTEQRRGTRETNLDDNGLCDQVAQMLRSSSRKKMVLEEILKHLKQITSKMKDNDEEDSMKMEWKGVAKILDRFFLMLFVLLVIVSSSVLLFFYPLSSKKLKL